MLLRTALISSITLTLSLHAMSDKAKISMSNIAGKANQNNVLQSKSYQNAYTLFNQKKYSEASKAFAILADKYPENTTINFYYARTLFELKSYEQAFTIYDKLLINEPENAKIRVEYARTLYMMGSLKEAKEEFNKVLASPIPPIVRKNIERFIKAIDEQDKDYIFNKVAIFGFGYDNNIGTNSGDEYTDSLIKLDNNDKKKGTNFKTILVGNYIKPFKSNKNLSWESLGIGYFQKQNQVDDYDVWLVSLSSGIAYSNKKYKNLTSFLYDRIAVARDLTTQYYGIANSQKLQLENSLLSLDLRYKRKLMFQETDYDKDSTIKEAVINYSLPFKAQKITLNLMTSYSTERQDHGREQPDVDQNTKKYKIGVTKEFPKDYSGTLSFQKEYGKYKNPFIDGVNSIIREDTIKTITLSVDKKLDKTKMVSVEVNKITDKSTFDSTYSYDKKTVNVNYMVIF